MSCTVQSKSCCTRLLWQKQYHLKIAGGEGVLSQAKLRHVHTKVAICLYARRRGMVDVADGETEV